MGWYFFRIAHSSNLSIYHICDEVIDMLIKNMDPYLEGTEIADFDESKVKFFEYNGVYHSYMLVNNKPYRVRVETIVFNDKGQVFLEKRSEPNTQGLYYKLPGGSVEPNKKFISQAIREVQEEARMNISRVKYTGIHFMVGYDENHAPESLKKKIAMMPIHPVGCINFIYIGDYKSPYTGHIDKEALDDLYKKAKWYDIEDIPFCEEHAAAIKMHK